MKNLTFIIPQETGKPFVAPASAGPAAGMAAGTTSHPIQGRMSDREVDQQLVERAQRGEKRAFELLVIKYQRKLERLLSRIIRDPNEIEDVAQEAFVKAYRALPNFRGDSAFYTWLYRIGINTAKNYLIAQGRRAPTSTAYDSEEAEGFDDAEGLRDINTPENLLMSKQIGKTVNDAIDALPEELRTAITLREIDGLVLRGDREDHGLPDRHGPVAHLPGPRGGGGEAPAATRDHEGPKMVKTWQQGGNIHGINGRQRPRPAHFWGWIMTQELSSLMDGELEADEAGRVIRGCCGNEALKQKWQAYHLIGEAMRGEGPCRRRRHPADHGRASNASPPCWRPAAARRRERRPGRLRGGGLGGHRGGGGLDRPAGPRHFRRARPWSARTPRRRATQSGGGPQRRAAAAT